MGVSKDKKDIRTGFAVLLLYAALIAFIDFFHEPWFDETQAWLIARCASYREIFTYIPHYEGHPPLWYLILSVFAKSGAPFELSLKSVNLVFCTAAMALLIFRSPFPKPVRYLLPFTYFFFYHYGVYCRPYSMTMLAVFLAAITFRDRNAHPWRYILSLVFICLTTAFGIMISGGLCIVWTCEIIAELLRSKKLHYFWKDKRFHSLCFILAVAVMLILMILPAEDCYYGGVDSGFTLKDRLLSLRSWCDFAAMPFESWSGVMVGLNGFKDMHVLIVFEAICGAVMWFSISAVALKNRKFFVFFVPYALMCGFMSFKYSSAHHFGIGALVHVFIFWIMAEQEGGIVIPDFMKKMNETLRTPLVRKLVYGAAGLICVAPIFYSIGASVGDIMWNCSPEPLADTIKENHLDDKKILVRWTVMYDNLEKGSEEAFNKYMFNFMEMPSPHDVISENRTYLIGTAAIIQPYFDKNIFMNFNVDCPDDLYMHYKYKEDSEAVFAEWRKKGLPDFIIGYCPLDEVYSEEELKGVRYLPIQSVEYSLLYKLDSSPVYERLYIREDLMDDYPQFKWIDDQTDNHY